MKREDIIIKYPRTPHIQGSRLQPGDEDLTQRRFGEIAGRHLVLEEKIDGATRPYPSPPTASCASRAADTSSPAVRAKSTTTSSNNGAPYTATHFTTSWATAT